MGIPKDLLEPALTIMKAFTATLLACLISAISADVTCDDCLTFSGNMQAYLMSDESIAEQTELLVALLCPSAPDPAGCETGIRDNWGAIGLAMYPVFLEANSVCAQLGACKVKTLVAEPTCDECWISCCCCWNHWLRG